MRFDVCHVGLKLHRVLLLRSSNVHGPAFEKTLFMWTHHSLKVMGMLRVWKRERQSTNLVLQY